MCKTKEEYTMIRSGSLIIESDNDLEIVGTIVSGFDYLNNVLKITEAVERIIAIPPL